MTTLESNEMANLPSSEPATASASAATTTATAQQSSTARSTPTPGAAPYATSSSVPKPTDENITAVPTFSTTAPAMQRKESEAIGSASDDTASAVPKADPDAGVTLHITLLLTTGKRHPYKIDTKYLRKRNVTVEDNDPYNLPVQTLKELILRDWREDWEEKPNSPSAIRLISMGLELQEGELLRDKRLNPTGPNIVHMVIKRELPDDEDIKDSKKKGSNQDGGRRGSNGCCCVIL